MNIAAQMESAPSRRGDHRHVGIISSHLHHGRRRITCPRRRPNWRTRTRASNEKSRPYSKAERPDHMTNRRNDDG
jgi:hypothetical protein